MQRSVYTGAFKMQSASQTTYLSILISFSFLTQAQLKGYLSLYLSHQIDRNGPSYPSWHAYSFTFYLPPKVVTNIVCEYVSIYIRPPN